MLKKKCSKKKQKEQKRINMQLLMVLGFALLFPFDNTVAEEYLSQKDFIEQSLGIEAIIKAVWINSALRSQIKEDLNKTIPSARVRYWESDGKRAWILNEIGRDKPITMGFVIQNKKISMLRILAFRESRGYEVRYPRFTSQFSDLGLKQRASPNDEFSLEHSIDNVTGATLSVNGVKKAAKLALYLNERVELASQKN
jgi:hypothetical protein